MKKGRMESVVCLCRHKSFRALVFVGFVYVFLTYQMPFILEEISSTSSSPGAFITEAVPRTLPLREEAPLLEAPVRPSKVPFRAATASVPPGMPPAGMASGRRRAMQVSGLVFNEIGVPGPFSELHRAARDAWRLGEKVLSQLGEEREEEAGGVGGPKKKNRTEENCPHSIVMSGAELWERGKVLVIPCGMTLGSHVTIVAKPNSAHPEYGTQISISRGGEQPTMVSQFMIELQGLKTVDGEDPPRILHYNPRLKGDWSGKPVIEQNTCYRMQWGAAQRCEGWRSRADEEIVDGFVKCERWIRDDDNRSEESKTTWWLNRLIGRTRKVPIDWPYPFVEDELFVLTLSAGLEGYHVSVDGRHITSFPYRTGFALEDATGLSLNGDISVDSIFAGTLPTTHPSFSPDRQLEMSSQWQAPPLPNGSVELFVGILSAGNHFAERMAVRKSWMQSVSKSPNMVARFFVAMHGRKEINEELKKEAEFFGDIVIVPFMDSYDLVVLKTVAICEYGVRVVSAKYIMKCDDDTFVKIDSVMRAVKKIPTKRNLYLGNMNYHHKPLRFGKWAVTYEEWPEEDYPPYANGPGYVISAEIAHFIVSGFEKHKLRLFKMEDVSVGMWIQQFNHTKPVEYVHSLRFCQFGCVDGYITAHYQSPRQMLCLWDKLKQGRTQCCNVR